MPDFLPVRVQDFLHRWKSELREREQIRPGDDGRPLQSERIVGVLILQSIFADCHRAETACDIEKFVYRKQVKA